MNLVSVESIFERYETENGEKSVRFPHIVALFTAQRSLINQNAQHHSEKIKRSLLNYQNRERAVKIFFTKYGARVKARVMHCC
jgi:hypothetical protein